MDEVVAPAANNLGGVGVWEAVRMQRQFQQGLLLSLWLDYIAQQGGARERISSWMAQSFSHQYRRQLNRDLLRFIQVRHG